MSMLRLFLAVEINDAVILDKITQIQKKLGDTKTKMTLVRPENLHLTLKFLGNTSETLVDSIFNIMQKIDSAPFQVEIGKLGCFPRPARPRVIWLGLSLGYDQLAQIATFLDKKLHTLGFDREKRKFAAHLTLARVKSRSDPKLVQYLEEYQNVEIGNIAVDEIVLKKSTLTPKGPIYESLRKKTLI